MYDLLEFWVWRQPVDHPDWSTKLMTKEKKSHPIWARTTDYTLETLTKTICWKKKSGQNENFFAVTLELFSFRLFVDYCWLI